jgi:hypothetical protein
VTIAVSGDDQQTALIGGEDLCRLEIQELLGLRPDLVLIVGGPLAPEIEDLVTRMARAGSRYVLVGVTQPPQASTGMEVTVLT